ncbi:MAG: hypothetical protein QOG87_3677 [Actinomycetota bacterium]|jgi:hypothetical protein
MHALDIALVVVVLALLAAFLLSRVHKTKRRQVFQEASQAAGSADLDLYGSLGPQLAYRRVGDRHHLHVRGLGTPVEHRKPRRR